MSELRDRAVKGISWSLIAQLLRFSLTLVIGITLARLLAPHDFGLIAMIIAFTGFADLFTTFGFGAALVQAQNLQKEHFSSIFWVNIVSGLLLTSLFIFLAPSIGKFYEEPALVPIIRFMALSFSIRAISVVPWCILTREMNFKLLAIAELSAIITAGAIAVTMAFMGFGVWSLAVQSVLSATLSTILLCTLSKWKPLLIYSHSAVKELFKFSVHVFGDMFLSYASRSIDSLLIGKFFGASALGPYNRAYSLMLMPVVNFANVMARVMFPAMSTIQSERLRVRSAMLRGTGIIALVTFPMMMGLLAAAETVILVIFGEKWIEMVPFLGAFCFAGMVLSATSLFRSLYMSQGRADLQLRVGVITKLIQILGMVIGLYWGPIGVAYGYLVALCITSYPEVYFAGRLVGFGYIDFLRVLFEPLVCSLLMAVLVFLADIIIPVGTLLWLKLGLQVVIGIVAYSMLVHMANLESYKELCLIGRQYYMKRTNPDGQIST